MPDPAELSSIYQDAEHFDLLALLTAPPDLPFYLERVAAAGGPVLELGCGTGRLCIPLASQGHQIWGLDLSAPLLERARRKAAELGAAVELRHGDLRSFDLARQFRLVLMPYNVFNHLTDLPSISGCLSSVRRHLGAGSQLIIDTFNPSLRALSSSPTAVKPVIEYVHPKLRVKVVLTEQNAYDEASQINTITWSYKVGEQEAARVDVLRMRIFFPQELDGLLSLNGFEIEQKLGDYDGRPFTSSSPKQLMICRLTR
jgi:2-polyprenyl-3-methyl-5-hydroxy-6-metoxy-1,4-benzoquinol methylase